ncbi:MAG: hypothetical protein LIV24_11410 [Eubacterium sp.]|nr:hypothetical protein [Eubacterium sp.]
MNYFIRKIEPENHNAGFKAPKDICRICEKMGWREIRMPSPDRDGKISSRVWQLKTLPGVWRNICHQLQSGDTLLYQHPLYFGAKIAYSFLKKLHKKGVHLIVIIHDMESIRNFLCSPESSQKKVWEDGPFLDVFDRIICHNAHMCDYLISKGFSKKKLITLDIFDYLCDGIPGASTSTYAGTDKAYGQKSIVIAGNLDPAKCGYIYQAAQANPDLTFRLYGGNYRSAGNLTNTNYMGSFPPETIPTILEGSFGLVWDGPDLSIHPNTMGDYLRYNNPHKCSLYLASGLPVIIWDKAALADFVTQNQVGITIPDLTALSSRVNSLSQEEYLTMKRQAEQIGQKLREGYYFTRAIHEALDSLTASS